MRPPNRTVTITMPSSRTTIRYLFSSILCWNSPNRPFDTAEHPQGVCLDIRLGKLTPVQFRSPTSDSYLRTRVRLRNAE